MEHLMLEMARIRGEELRREAARSRLAGLDACCHPSTWRRAAARLHAVVGRPAAVSPAHC